MDVLSNAISSRYDRLAGQECCLSCGKAIAYASIKTGNVCIDLGSGQGHDVLRMAILTGSSGFVYGVDISDGMMTRAREQASRLKLGHVAFVHAPLEQTGLEDQVADVLISNCTINHSANQAGVWREIVRLLKPGGHFVVSDIYALDAVPAVYANDPAAVAECWAGAVTKEIYMANVSGAGISGLELLEESLPYDKGKIKVASFTIRGFKPL